MATVEAPTLTRVNCNVGCAVAAAGLLLLGAAAHVAYLVVDCPLDLSGDEAHYWEWARRLDLSYYSKGPLVAYIIAAGRWAFGDLSMRLVGSEALAVRLPAVLLSLVTGFGLYRLAMVTLGRPTVALAAVAITFTIPILSVGAILMTIDAPLAACWVWALVAAHRALADDRPWAWIALGALTAVGILAKYTMLLIYPVVGGAMLLLPAFHRHLRRPTPYIAAFVGLLGFVPIVIWNAQHAWVSFRHVSGQAGLGGGGGVDVAGVFAFLAGQAGVIGPLWFVGLMLAVIAAIRQPREGGDDARRAADVQLLAIAAIVPFGVCFAFSFVTKVQPNWPVLGVFPGVILMARWIGIGLRVPEKRRTFQWFTAASVVIGLAVVLVAHRSDLLIPVFARMSRNAPVWDATPVAKHDPAARLRGWAGLGVAVQRVLDNQQTAGRSPFVLTDDYQVASEIAFYAPSHPTVYCAQAALGDRESQYDIWHNPLVSPGDFVGRPVIYVGSLRPEIAGDDRRGGALPGVRSVVTVQHRVRGELLRVWTISVAEAFAGFPASQTANRRF